MCIKRRDTNVKLPVGEVGVAVGGSGVGEAGMGVSVGVTGGIVAVGGNGVFVGGAGVTVGGTAVLVAVGAGVSVGTTVAVGSGVSVGTSVAVAVGSAVSVAITVAVLVGSVTEAVVAVGGTSVGATTTGSGVGVGKGAAPPQALNTTIIMVILKTITKRIFISGYCKSSRQHPRHFQVITEGEYRKKAEVRQKAIRKKDYLRAKAEFGYSNFRFCLGEGHYDSTILA
jgi:hypothetical protein